MSPLDRGPREHSETYSNVPIHPLRAPKRHFHSFPAPPPAPRPGKKKSGRSRPDAAPIESQKCPHRTERLAGFPKHVRTSQFDPRGPRYGIIPAFQPARGPRRAPKTNRGHISIKTTRASPKSDPIGQSGSRTFQNIFGRPNSTISGPDAAVSRGGEGQVATWVGT